MAHILAISRYFPPLSSAGSSLRLVKFIKYAAEKGWQFSVITQDPAYPVIPEKSESDFLLDELPHHIQIIRIGNPIVGNSFFQRISKSLFKNSSLPWGFSVFWKCHLHFNKYKPVLVFANSPPFTNAVIGYGLAAKFQIPFVLDMKDDWIGTDDYLRKRKLRQEIEKWIERIIVKKAGKVITVTNSSYKTFTDRYMPLGLSEKFSYIPNGEDLDEFNFLRTRIRKIENVRFRLTTSAAGYRPDYRDLSPLIQTLEIFLSHYPGARQWIEIEFIGEEIEAGYKQRLENLLSPNQVIVSGVLQRRALIDHLWLADLFFLIQPRKNFTAISGTLYEYWATGKAPILLFSETGASSNLISQNHLGEQFHFEDFKKAAEYFERIYKAWTQFKPEWIEYTGAEKYDRKALTDKMIAIWMDVINKTQ